MGCGGLWRDAVEETGTETGGEWDEIPIFHSPISPFFRRVKRLPHSPLCTHRRTNGPCHTPTLSATAASADACHRTSHKGGGGALCPPPPPAAAQALHSAAVPLPPPNPRHIPIDTSLGRTLPQLPPPGPKHVLEERGEGGGCLEPKILCTKRGPNQYCLL